MNDERPIEKLLRRYAKKRRDEAGAPLELHPATRRLLLGEVSRQFPKSGPERKNAFASWFNGFRRRWIYSAAALSVVLIAGVMLMMQDKRPQFSAKRQDLALAKDKESALETREADVARGDSTPTPAAAADSELALNQPTPASPASPDSYGLKSDLPMSATLNASADRLRVLNDESAPASPSSLPRNSGQVTLAPKTISGKAPQAIAPAEEYSSAARAAQSSSQRLAGKPETPPPATASASESQPPAVAAPRPIARFADSSAGRDSKVTTTTAATANAAAGATVAVESRYGLATLARGGGIESDRTPAVSQSFANLAPIGRAEKVVKAAPASPVLANFQVEQTGDLLRVIDSDGSSYLGGINAASVSSVGGSKSQLRFKGEEKLAEPAAAAAPASKQQSAQIESYRVEGTNRTLNQKVVFTWNFVPLTNAQAQSKTKVVDGVLNQNNLVAPQQIQTLLQNSAINGRAQINAATEIEINAVPVTR